jgi:LAO/AO transport system kinase
MCKFILSRRRFLIFSVFFSIFPVLFLTPSVLKRRYPLQTYLEGILAQDRFLLSQAITLTESQLASDQELAQDLLEALLPYTGKSLRIGITGVPGVGKSTFIEAFGSFLLHNEAISLAVLTIDPSSPLTKGSILGDKTRMEVLSRHPRAYIRPSPSALSLGGVARKTRESLLLCEAAGFDMILVETVGVGQSEVLVKEMTDFFLLLMLTGAGDELQGIKKGIMEMADLLVIHKADGTNLSQAAAARTAYETALHYFPPAPSGWITRVLLASSTQPSGMEAIWQTLR